MGQRPTGSGRHGAALSGQSVRFPAMASARVNASTGTAYSGTPLPKKLGIKPDHRIALLNAPDGFETDSLADRPR